VQAHEHLARARGRELQLSDLERRPGVLEDGRADLQGASPACGGLCCSSRSASTE
jgi:hypothetical protein